MKYIKLFEKFTKEYQSKIDLKDFKKIKKGSKIQYMGGPVEVVDNNGYVLKLKDDDGKTFTVNKSQFDHGGRISEVSDGKKKKKKKEFHPDMMYEASKDRMINQIKRALKDGVSIFKLPMATQTYYRNNKGDFEEFIEEGVDAKDIIKTIKAVSKQHKTTFANPFLMHEEPTHIHKKLGPVKIHPGVRAYDWRKDGRIAVSTSLQGSKDWNFTGVDLKDLSELPRNFKLPKNWLSESKIDEAKDNLYLQLHNKYAEQVKGLKAKKINKLTDLVSVQRRSMEDREDYFNMNPKKKKELSAEYNEERKLFKKYMARDYSVMLPKGTESLRESSSKDGGDKSNGNSHHDDHQDKSIAQEWKDTYGEEFHSKYPAIAKIIKQRNIKDKRELSRIWQDTYDEDFEEQYPALFNKLD